MGFLSDLFGDEDVQYQYSPQGQTARKGLQNALDIALGNVGKTYDQDVTIQPSQLTSTVAEKLQNRLDTPFQYNFTGDDLQGYLDKLNESTMAKFDYETPKMLEPLLESQIAKGQLGSGAGTNQAMNWVTERDLERSNLQNQMNLQEVSTMQQLEDALQQYQLTDFSNAFQVGGRLEDIDKYNTEAEQALYWKNLNLPLEQASTFANISNAMMPLEQAATQVEQYNASTQSPFSSIMQSALANIVGNLTSGTSSPSSSSSSGLSTSVPTSSLNYYPDYNYQDLYNAWNLG